MFKKKPQIKTLAPLRSSDRRKITDQIIAEYQLEIPRTGAIVGEDEANGNSGIGELRNSLLPEGCLSAKFSTTAGQDLKTVTGIIYVGTLLGEEPRILWIRLEDRMIPTGEWLNNFYDIYSNANRQKYIHCGVPRG
jgi:translation initiation factor 2D